ncbi:MAG: hypothetical protein ACFFDH_25340 [Promethearchaeota archaeon]
MSIFLDINVYLLMSAITFLIILFIFGFIFEFTEAKIDNNKKVNEIFENRLNLKKQNKPVLPYSVQYVENHTS